MLYYVFVGKINVNRIKKIKIRLIKDYYKIEAC